MYFAGSGFLKWLQRCPQRLLQKLFRTLIVSTIEVSRSKSGYTVSPAMKSIFTSGTLLTRLQQDGQFAQYIQDDRERLEAELQVHQQYLLVVEQLKTLSIPYQEVIALRYFEGKNNKEIAEILDIKEGTIKSLLSRGLERLRMKCNQL